MIDFKKKDARFVIANKSLVCELLAMNTHNRKPKRSVIEMYEKDMANGTFIATNQGIGVSRSGVLLDGQNRLYAMKNLDFPPIEFLLVTGLDDIAQRYVDKHAKRTQADIIKLTLNQTVSNLAIAALNLRQVFKTLSTTDRLTIDELADQLVEHNEELATIIGHLRRIRKAPVVAALLDYWLLVGSSRAVDLAEQIGAGELLERNDPAYKIRQVIEQPLHHGSTGQLRLYRMMISACVAHSQNKKMSLLKETETWPNFKRAGEKNE